MIRDSRRVRERNFLKKMFISSEPFEGIPRRQLFVVEIAVVDGNLRAIMHFDLGIDDPWFGQFGFGISVFKCFWRILTINNYFNKLLRCGIVGNINKNQV